MTTRQWLLWLAIVLSVGIALRFFRLGHVPASLYWDEVAILTDAKSVASTGRDMHGNTWLQAIFPSYGDYKLPVYIWLASLSVKFFGVSNWALRLPSAVAGMGTVLLSGAIVWQLFFQLKIAQRRLLALLTMSAVTLSPWSIVFSRAGFEGHLAQFFLSASIWLVLKSRSNWWWLIGSALLGATATYSYYAARFVWPVVLAAAVFLFIWKKKQKFWSQLVKTLVIPLIVYAVTIAPIQRSPLYPASQQFRLSTLSVLNMADWPIESNTYKLQVGNTIFDKLVYHPWVLIGREMAKNYSDNLSVDFLFATGDANLRHGTGRHGLFMWPMLIPFAYGWYAIFKKQWRSGWLLLIWWLAALLPASVPEETPHALRSLNALMPLSIIIGWGSWRIWKVIQRSDWSKHLKQAALASAVALVFLTGYDFTRYYFEAYPILSAKDWQSGYEELAAEVWQESQTADVVWVGPFDGRFYLWLLAYQAPPADFSKIEFINFIPQAIGNIRLHQANWEKLPDTNQSTVLVSQKDFIDEQLLTPAIKQPEWYKTFYTADGQAAYAMVYFGKVK